MSLEVFNAQCVLCESQYKTFRRLKRHFKKRHGGLEGLQCTFCDYISPHKLLLKEHMEKIHLDEKYVCEKCDFKTRKWTRMERHSNRHKTATLEDIPSSEHTKSRMIEAFQSVFDEFIETAPKNTDQDCKVLENENSSIDSQNLLKNNAHFIKGSSTAASKPDVMNDGQMSFYCHFVKDCPVLKGSKTKRLNCEWCDMTFRHRGHLNVHLRIHTGEKPYKCFLCNFSARHGSTIDRHKKAHFNDRRYACDACDYKSVYKSTLQRHYRTHTGVKPFTCEFCQRSFSQRGLMKRHRRKDLNAPVTMVDKQHS